MLWGTEEEMKRQRELEKLEQEQNKNESTQEVCTILEVYLI